MKRIFAYFLLILAAFFLQNNVFAASPLILTVPNIMLILVFSFGFIRGSVDGMCIGANKKYARTLLRDTMKFRGMLTSDGAAIMKMYNYFHIAPTYKEAGLLAKRAGSTQRSRSAELTVSCRTM